MGSVVSLESLLKNKKKKNISLVNIGIHFALKYDVLPE